MNFLPQDKRLYLLAIGLVLFLIVLRPLVPPISFPTGTIVTVPEGAGLYELAEKLKEDKVIRSPAFFRAFAIVFGGERSMKAGEYFLSAPQSTFVIASRVLGGDYGVETIRKTVLEGFTIIDIANLFDERFTEFDREDFLEKAPEGYLFPDTYFLPVTATADFVIRLLEDNFENKIAPKIPEIELTEHSLEDIVVMASIIERETKTQEDRITVSGILWKRIELGIPLQVDASFIAVNGKSTKDLTLDDLKIDSPFNTYVNRGLPPAPIANPGIFSIDAAINPKDSEYLYFLTGNDGVMRYSETFDEHIENKRRYLR